MNAPQQPAIRSTNSHPGGEPPADPSLQGVVAQETPTSRFTAGENRESARCGAWFPDHVRDQRSQAPPWSEQPVPRVLAWWCTSLGSERRVRTAPVRSDPLDDGAWVIGQQAPGIAGVGGQHHGPVGLGGVGGHDGVDAVGSPPGVTTYAPSRNRPRPGAALWLSHPVRRVAPVVEPGGRRVPRISAFYGIVISMFFGDHLPPHFHARYGEHGGRFLLDGQVLDGDLPPRARRLVQEWARLHEPELVAAWDRAVMNEPPGTIEPLP